ncbi:MAG: alpha/beta fold hydrolase [Thermoleophilaceae bacterium]
MRRFEPEVDPQGGAGAPSVPRFEARQLHLHGHRAEYRIAGSGPPVVLIHGMVNSSRHWEQVALRLAADHTVIAPDLIGHGDSTTPRGDYSLGAHAASIRDLLAAIGVDRASIVGHSLGGGVAMQFAYQFPERCERLALVSSGGLGTEVHLLLRAATLPGSEFVLPLIAHQRLRQAGEAVGRALQAIGLRAGPDVAELARGYGSLSDAEARGAFIHTLRAVIDPTGQRVSATDRLYLAQDMPTLIVWGRRDPIIPATHAGTAHKAMPGSRLVLLDDAGHFPQLDDPLDFATILQDFVNDTEPAQVDAETLRDRVLAGPD